MVRKHARLGVVGIVGALAALGAVVACTSESSSSGIGTPPPAPPDDPGCQVTLEVQAGLPGEARFVVHGLDGGLDGGDAATEAGTPGVEAEAGAPDGGDADAGTSEPDGGALGVTLDRTSTVVCRKGTRLETAAGPGGSAYVLATSIRGQLITLGEAADVRKLDYLPPGNSEGRIAATPDGEPFMVVRLGATSKVVRQEGDAPSVPVDVGASVSGVSRRAATSDGTLLFALDMADGTKGLLRDPAGSVSTIDLPPRGSAFGRVVAFGIDDVLQPFTVAWSDSVTDVTIGTKTLKARGASGAAFAIAPGSSAPVLALGGVGDEHTLGVAFAPADDGLYDLVSVVPGPEKCLQNPTCDNTCTESGGEVEASELDLVRAGDDVLVVFVRRQVSRERRYRMQSSGGGLIECTLFDCDPRCVSDASRTLESAELVVGRVDVARREVHELRAVPLDVKSGSIFLPGRPGVSEFVVQADAREGFLHVGLATKNQDAAMAVYRFNLGRGERVE